jgi:hypothetical protein
MLSPPGHPVPACRGVRDRPGADWDCGVLGGSITFHVGYRHEFTGDNTDNPDPRQTVSAVLGMDGFPGALLASAGWGDRFRDYVVGGNTKSRQPLRSRLSGTASARSLSALPSAAKQEETSVDEEDHPCLGTASRSIACVY